MEQWIGWVAGTCTTISLIPQFVHIIRHRSAHAVSWLMFLIFTFGIVLWLIYGILRHDNVLVIFNAITLMFSIAVMLAKWYFDHHCPSRSSQMVHESSHTKEP